MIPLQIDSARLARGLQLPYPRRSLARVREGGRNEGVSIGRHHEATPPVPVRPHLMEREVVMRLGRRVPPVPLLARTGGAFAEQAALLASDDAHALEQEVLGLRPVDVRRH